MPFSESQLHSLLEAVERLVQAQAALKKDNQELRDQLDAAKAEVEKAKQANSETHIHSNPPPSTPTLNAEELDALVEDIDSCIALLKTED